MNSKYFLIYLIYGFFMLNMGIFCLKESGRNFTKLSLLRSLKYLGWFGVIHGLSEWVTMVALADLYPAHYADLFHAAQILKAVSFAVLMHFGFDLMRTKNRFKKAASMIPSVMLVVYLSGYMLLIRKYGTTYHMTHLKFGIIAMRYDLALLSGIVASSALFRNARAMAHQKSAKIIRRYKQLAWVILINGLLEGLLVQKEQFFPANLINREVFQEVFLIESLFLKAIIGLLINYLLVRVISTFSWEQESHFKELESHKIITEERRKISIEIHDSIIQSLYAVGLKLEYLLMTIEEMQPSIGEIKKDLNTTIEQTRSLMTSTAVEAVALEDLHQKIEVLIAKYTQNKELRIRYRNEVPPDRKNGLSLETSTQIYYIVQEALCNVIKHSRAGNAEVLLETEYSGLSISVVDDGIGISPGDFQKEDHFGIQSMRERAGRIGGRFEMTNKKRGKGLKVSVTGIPWEDSDER